MTFKELLNRVRFDDVAHKLSLRFVAKWKAFYGKMEGVLWQNGRRFAINCMTSFYFHLTICVI